MIITGYKKNVNQSTFSAYFINFSGFIKNIHPKACILTKLFLPLQSGSACMHKLYMRTIIRK